MTRSIQKLGNETIWIIGASSGIGEELSAQYALAGYKVVASARRETRLNELVSRYNENIAPLVLDINDNVSVQRAVEQLVSKNNLPHTIVINAGIYTPQSVDKYLFQNSFDTMNTNYLGVCRILDQLLPHLLRRKKGKIVIVASVAGYQGLPKSLSYGPSKAALINLAEGLHMELKDKGIHVQVVNPGFVKTPLTQQNRFPMPFLLDVEKAASLIRKGIQSDRFEIAFPLPFVLILKTIRLLPYRLSLSLIRRMTTK
ncbi:SDR family NAD(P)-dependent oxidoreductase [Sneathiella glossodoripedis]|uniref:SDR family NAD(P)-dependent oxidoreductase n=1 Tax=Sneathiella glossodoripedis TaxID=418853 RepID=UPI000472AD4F|nr:SDR family NAD(P)-dependent oxidoreductase [Sneathiella glossodoripedis]